MTPYSLLTNNLVSNLIELLSKEMGLKSPTLAALSIFGIKVM
jgi:hypothetical protein